MRLRPYVIACSVPCGCEAGTLEPPAPSDQTSNARTLPFRPNPVDTGSRYEATVQVSSQEMAEGRAAPPACSGIVIAPRLILTAAHCVCKRRHVTPGEMAKLLASADDDPPASDLISRAQRIKGRTVTAITTASDCASRATATTARYPETGDRSVPRLKTYEGAVRVHREAELLYEEETNIWATADLAVISLTKDVEGIVPVALTDAEVKEGDRITLVGYGTSPVNNLQRRVGENEVSEIRELASGGVEFVAKRQQLEDGGIASQLIHGDSGGGCFKVVDDTAILVGVNAARSRDIWDRVSSTFTSVYAYRDWLNREIAEARAGRALPDRGAVKGARGVRTRSKAR